MRTARPATRAAFARLKFLDRALDSAATRCFLFGRDDPASPFVPRQRSQILPSRPRHRVRAERHAQVSRGFVQGTGLARLALDHHFIVPVPRTYLQPDHLRTSRSQIAHLCIAELGHCTLTVNAPRRTSTRIGVSPAGFTCTGKAMNPSLGGGNALGPPTPSARSASTTQHRSRLALIAPAIAAAAIDVPGCRQAATASALNAALCARRRRRPDPRSIVCTSPPISLS
jgi:hypothetical protein